MSPAAKAAAGAAPDRARAPRSPPSAPRSGSAPAPRPSKLPIAPLALWQAIGEILPEDVVIIDETLSSGPGLRQLLAGDDAKSFFGMRGGGIGWGLPAAVGVKLALPDRPVLALIGDGSAMFNCQALWTAAHERLAVVFLILNNGAYRILKQRVNALRGHAAQTGRYVAMDLDRPLDRFRRARALHGRAPPSAPRPWTRSAPPSPRPSPPPARP